MNSFDFIKINENFRGFKELSREYDVFSDDEERIVFSSDEMFHVLKSKALYTYLCDLYVINPGDSKINSRYHSIKKLLMDTDIEFKGQYFIKKTSFAYPSNDRVSRILPIGSSMVKLSRELRFILFEGLYEDVDLINSHPSILLEYARNIGLSVPMLEELVVNRDAIFKIVSEANNMDTSRTKKVFLTAMNMTAVEFTNYNSKNKSFELLNSFFSDILRIRESLWEEFYVGSVKTPGVYKSYLENVLNGFSKKTLEKQKVNSQVLYCFSEESSLLLGLHAHLERRTGLLNMPLNFIPFFDGAYIRVDNKQVIGKSIGINNTTELLTIFVDEYNAEIKPLKFAFKKIEPNWTVLESSVFDKYLNIEKFMVQHITSDQKLQKLQDKLEMQGFKLDVSKIKPLLEHMTKKALTDAVEKLNNGEIIELVEQQTLLYGFKFREKLLIYAETEDSLLHFYSS